MLFHVVAFILLLLLLGKSKNKHDITTNEPSYTVIATLLERFQLSVVYYTFLLSCRFVAYRRLAKAIDRVKFFLEKGPGTKFQVFLLFILRPLKMMTEVSLRCTGRIAKTNEMISDSNGTKRRKKKS
jgi:hypothetical protein